MAGPPAGIPLFWSGMRILFSICLLVAALMAGPSLHASPADPGGPSIELFPSSVSEDSSSCVIPFSRAGNLILVKAKADSMEGNFVLDSGAPYLVLNITYFRDYPVTHTMETEEASVSPGGGSAVQKTKLRSLHVGNFLYPDLSADLVNLGQIENSKGVKILGLLGLELFRDCELIIDHEKNLIYLHRIGRKESSSYRHVMLEDATAYNTFPIEIVQNKIITTSELEGKKLRLVIDCGAESNLLDSRLPNKIFSHVVITGRTKLVGAGNKAADALFGNVQHMKIGNEDIATLPVMIVNLENTCFSDIGCIDGVLGIDFLSLHKVGFNFVNRKMYIWK